MQQATLAQAFETICYEKRGTTAHVTVNRPVGGMASSAPCAKIGRPIRALTHIRTVGHRFEANEMQRASSLPDFSRTKGMAKAVKVS
jgi:hypothetical protein